MKITNSPENVAFFEYTKFTSTVGRKASILEPKIKSC